MNKHKRHEKRRKIRKIKGLCGIICKNTIYCTFQAYKNVAVRVKYFVHLCHVIQFYCLLRVFSCGYCLVLCGSASLQVDIAFGSKCYILYGICSILHFYIAYCSAGRLFCSIAHRGCRHATAKENLFDRQHYYHLFATIYFQIL